MHTHIYIYIYINRHIHIYIHKSTQENKYAHMTSRALEGTFSIQTWIASFKNPSQILSIWLHFDACAVQIWMGPLLSSDTFHPETSSDLFMNANVCMYVCICMHTYAHDAYVCICMPLYAYVCSMYAHIGLCMHMQEYV